METIYINKEITDNKIEGNPILENSKINFNGKGNILYCEEKVDLTNCTINFNGNNSVIYLASNKNKYILNVSIYNNSVLYIGKDNYMNGKLNIILSEQKNVIIGDDCLFSFDIWMRLADPHIIYQCDTKKRINLSKSIYIGDHVWIGQHAMILKGTHIGSGSIIGAMSVVSGKKIPSNESWAGNPVKRIVQGIFYDSKCVHTYCNKETENSLLYDSDEYIFKDIKEEKISFQEIEEYLLEEGSPIKKVEWLKQNLRESKRKNRFFIGNTNKRKFLFK